MWGCAVVWDRAAVQRARGGGQGARAVEPREAVCMVWYSGVENVSEARWRSECSAVQWNAFAEAIGMSAERYCVGVWGGGAGVPARGEAEGTIVECRWASEWSPVQWRGEWSPVERTR